MEQIKLADYKQVSEFYDKYWVEAGEKKLDSINSRHRFILKNLKKVGLRKNSKVMEIGCGSGILTTYIAKYIPRGKILAVDISSKTIELAREKYKKYVNIEWIASDMRNFIYKDKFDIVVFPDVLEHIPIEAHNNIFQTIRQLVHENSIILINIPHPIALEYHHKYTPHLLQIIDQPLHTDKFIKAIYDNGFYLESLESYSVFHDLNDYQNIIVRPKMELKKMIPRGRIELLIRSLKLRFKSLFY